MERKNLRIIFFGTPEFAAVQLEHLITNGYNILAAVTAPDKPSGRGKKISSSAVKTTALQFDIPLLQPEKLKNEIFLSELESYKADIFIVIAFRMLPEVVWKMPAFGTFNLHASLLPQYRGAAPINRVIMNGDSTTGLTTFLINEEIDAGTILLQQEMEIGPNENAGELHDRMLEEGKKLVVDTIELFENNNLITNKQGDKHPMGEVLKTAPKIFKTDCKINWSLPGDSIRNHIRGLSPYPAAFTRFITENGIELEVKIFNSTFEPTKSNENLFTLLTDNKTFLKVALADGYLSIHDLQQSGKKTLKVDDYLRGFKFDGHWKVL